MTNCRACGVQFTPAAHHVRLGRGHYCSRTCSKSAVTTHGDTTGPRKTAEYRAWRHMKTRCLNPKSKDYPLYGGRGVTICARWIDSFPCFLEDMGRRPSILHSLDRKDPNGIYEPSNCRWATATEQANNKRQTIRIESRFGLLTISELADRVGIRRETLKARLYRMPIEQALSMPVRVWGR